MLIQIALDPAHQAKAREYSRLSRRGLFFESGIGVALLLALLFTHASAMLADWLSFSPLWSAALYLLILTLGCGAIIAPLSYYQDFVLPHRYGLSTQNVSRWLKDKFKSLVLGLLLGLFLVTIIYWLMKNFPALWWLAASLIIFLLSLLLTWLTPTFLIPLFFKLNPLEDGELKERLMNLAQKAGVDIKACLTMNLSSKATTANAMLSGWGKSGRIIISDTLLQGYSSDEVEITIAHELAHHLHHDIAKLMAIQMGIFLLIFYLANLALEGGVALFSFHGIADIAGLPWLILVLALLILVFHPALNWYSRRIELAADKTALELTDNPSAFITLMTKLTDQNLSEAQPARWERFLFYDHLTYIERVKLARAAQVSPGQGFLSSTE